MGLTGTLKDGIVVTALPDCQFESMGPYAGPCDETAKYSVTFTDGTVWAACEEHVERLWEAEAVCVEEPL